MVPSRFSFGSLAALAGGLLLLTTPATRAEPAPYARAGSLDWPAPIFMTSINYPGLYGGYAASLASYEYNTRTSAPVFYMADTAAMAPRLVALTPPPPVAPPTPPAARESAHINVLVPPDASVWIQGTMMDGTGSARDYVSPPLWPGQDYSYTIRATWTDNGREVTRQRVVAVTAGQRVLVDLAPPARPVDGTSTLRPQPLP